MFVCHSNHEVVFSPLYAIHLVAVFTILSTCHLQCSLHQKSLSVKRAANGTCALFSCKQSHLCIPKVNCYPLGITPSLMLWNSLLLSMRTSSSLIIFKMLKHFFLNMPFIIVNIVDIKYF